MRLGKTKEVEASKVELVPLIDCVFLLLIFFMCAATMTKVDSAADVNLPTAPNAAEQNDPSHRGTVNILTVGTRTLKGELVTQEKPFLVFGELVDDEGLQRVVKQSVQEDPALRIYVRANRDVKYTMIRRAMEAGAAAGVSNIIFATHIQDLYLQENEK